MLDLIFVRFAVLSDGESGAEPTAVYCISLGSLAMGQYFENWWCNFALASFAGYRHLPLHDTQLS